MGEAFGLAVSVVITAEIIHNAGCPPDTAHRHTPDSTVVRGTYRTNHLKNPTLESDNTDLSVPPAPNRNTTVIVSHILCNRYLCFPKALYSNYVILMTSCICPVVIYSNLTLIPCNPLARSSTSRSPALAPRLRRSDTGIVLPTSGYSIAKPSA